LRIITYNFLAGGSAAPSHTAGADAALDRQSQNAVSLRRDLRAAHVACQVAALRGRCRSELEPAERSQPRAGSLCV